METVMGSPRSGYDDWLEQEGIPIVGGHGVEDMAEVSRGPWARLGGKGAYLKFPGLEGLTGLYVAEIPGGGALNPEKHLYEEIIYVLRGAGLTEVWHDEKQKRLFEWSEGSMFALPLNSWHRLINGGREPAILLGVTTAPMVMDIFHNPDFVLSSDYAFNDRYAGQDDYFQGEGKRYQKGKVTANVWETNFVPDVRVAMLERSPDEKVAGGHNAVNFEMASNILVGHITQWPVGRYHRAHYHPAGAVLVILESKGYTLMWPKEVGPRPYEAGHGDTVIKLDWGVGAAFTPPTDWFHQHFNTGPTPAKQLAFHYSSLLHRLEFRDGGQDKERRYLIALKDGGTMIDGETQDPAIHEHYLEALAAEGVEPEIAAASGSH